MTRLKLRGCHCFVFRYCSCVCCCHGGHSWTKGGVRCYLAGCVSIELAIWEVVVIAWMVQAGLMKHW